VLGLSATQAWTNRNRLMKWRIDLDGKSTGRATPVLTRGEMSCINSVLMWLCPEALSATRCYRWSNGSRGPGTVPGRDNTETCLDSRGWAYLSDGAIQIQRRIV
jgi:hypothetical protein